MDTGIFRITVDVKGRFSVPMKVRSSLESGNYILTYGVEQCLQILSEKEFSHLKDSINQKFGASFNKTYRILLRRFVAPAIEVSVDSAGRISIPRALREGVNLNLKEEAIFVNTGSFMEIWNINEYDEMTSSTKDELEEASSQLFDILNEEQS